MKLVKLKEDTVKTKDGRWTNKGEEGTHGKFKTKKEADAQRKAMFANGFKGESLKESTSEQDGLSKCSAVYKRLRNLIKNSDPTQLSIKDIIQRLFSAVDGKVRIKEASNRYVGYDGRVGDYTIGGSASLEYLKGDLNRLAEDLTMAVYRTNGGTKINYTPALIKSLTDSKNESLKEDLTREGDLYRLTFNRSENSIADKLLTLTNVDTFWDDVRKFTKNVVSDRSLRSWQRLAELRYNYLTTGDYRKEVTLKEEKIADKIKANQDTKEMIRRAIIALKNIGGEYKDLAKEFKDTYGEAPLKESSYSKKYEARAYYGTNFSGLESNLDSNDWSKIEDFCHDRLMNGCFCEIKNNESGKSVRITPDEYIDNFDGEFIYSASYLEEDLIDDMEGKVIKRYSDVYDDKVKQRGWWYFTTHGVQPGSIPNDLHVLEIRDGKNDKGTIGTFVRLDGILNTSELKKFDMKEMSPLNEDSRGDFSYERRLLGRLKSDCDYILKACLRNGMTVTSSQTHLWAGSVGNQIAKMRELHSIVPNADDIVTEEQIDDYEKKFRDELNKEDIPECLKEDWYHFEFASGSNPYITKDDREKKRILRKYKGKVTEVKPNFYRIDDKEEDVNFYLKEENAKNEGAVVKRSHSIKESNTNAKSKVNLSDVRTLFRNVPKNTWGVYKDGDGRVVLFTTSAIHNHWYAMKDFYRNFDYEELGTDRLGRDCYWVKSKKDLLAEVELSNKKYESVVESSDEIGSYTVRFNTRYGRILKSFSKSFDSLKQARKYATTFDDDLLWAIVDEKNNVVLTGWGTRVDRKNKSIKESKTPYGDTTVEDYVDVNFYGDEDDKKKLIDFVIKKSNGKDYFNGISMSVKDLESAGKRFGLSMKKYPVTEDVRKEWKPNTNFKHIKDVLETALERGKYMNNEREEVMAALDLCDKKKYTPEQRKFIRDSHQEMWRKNRKTESVSRNKRTSLKETKQWSTKYPQYEYEFDDGIKVVAIDEVEAREKYNDIIENRYTGVRSKDDIDSLAQSLYDSGDFWSFNYFSDEELAILWALCNIGRAYDDEVYEAIYTLPDPQSIFKKAQGYYNEYSSENKFNEGSVVKRTSTKAPIVSLNESSSQDLIDAIMWDYGCSKTEAKKLAKEMDDERKKLLVQGWKDQARKRFYESLGGYDFINYNDFLAGNFDGNIDDGIDDLMSDLNKVAKKLRTSSEKLVFYKDYEEESSWALDDIASVDQSLSEDYFIYDLKDSNIKFVIKPSSSLLIFRRENEGEKVLSELEKAVKSYNESLSFMREGIVDMSDDFNVAKEKWDELNIKISFYDALEKWNKESELAEPGHWYAKPIYSEQAWNDMVKMFGEDPE